MKITTNKQHIYTHIITFIGFFIFASYIWFRFVRECLPREIPFTLTEFTFYVILCIILLYIYAIKTLFYFNKPNIFLLKCISFLTMPFVFFDAFLKHNKYFYNYYYKLFLFLSSKIINSFIIHDKILYYFCFKIIPRIILISIFAVDVFYLHKIEIFYYFIFLGIIPLFYDYVKYSCEFALEQYIRHLELFYDEVLILEKDNYHMKDTIVEDTCDYKEAFGFHNTDAIYHDEFVTIRKYIELQAELYLSYILNNNTILYEYIGKPFSKDAIYKQYRKDYNKKDSDLTDEDYERLHEVFHNLEQPLISLYSFLEAIKTITSLPLVKIMHLIIYTFYIISWLYILMLSLSTLHELKFTLYILDILSSYAQELNPFSNIIDNNENIYK